MILALLAALFGAAQEALVVYEGATTTHYITNTPGNSYRWEMYKDFSPDVEADLSEYEFVSASNVDQVEVTWKIPGNYFLKVTETDPESCTNAKVLPVTVKARNRTIGFAEIISSSCVNNNNAFNLTLNTFDDNGNPLGVEYYPLNVDFMLNVTTFSQEISDPDQPIEIKDEWLTIDPGLNNTVEVQITEARDVSGLTIGLDANASVHTRTLWSIPEIEFISENQSITQGESFEHIVQMISGNTDNAEYTWTVYHENGTSTDLSLVKGNSATILWDGDAGNYEVRVFVTDANGCVSEVVRSIVTIKIPGSLVFDSAYPNTLICSDLSGGDEGSVPEHSESHFSVSYAGEANLLSAKITIKSPDGLYIGLDGVLLADQQNPEVEIINQDEGKNIPFSVIDNWENRTNSQGNFEILLISGITSDQQELQVVDGSDGKRTITVLTKPVIEFN